MKNAFLKYFSGFSKLNHSQRLEKLKDYGLISAEDISHLSQGVTRPELAENLIENVLGYFDLPLGVAVNFIIDQTPCIIPLAVEETSIIAAASKTARWACSQGEIKTQKLGSFSTGQIHIARVKDFPRLRETIENHFETWKEDVHRNILHSMVKRGGGLKGYDIRTLKRPDGKEMAVWHLYMETCDAMGANLINQVCEYLKNPLEEASKEEVTLCILSNLADKRLFRAEVIIRDQDPSLIQKIEEASLFGETDPYRAATSNKGVLNGIDALLIATGNDWRAVEAGLHAYACHSGQYRSLTQWRAKGKDLHGVLEGPFMLGTVGGVTDLHPTARLALKILGHPSGERLARISAALGLIQNLAALRALVTEGVIEGHMKLHIKNLALKAGATATEQPLLEKHLCRILKTKKQISFSLVEKTLRAWRSGKHNPGKSPVINRN